jgi:hypothetical protein
LDFTDYTGRGQIVPGAATGKPDAIRYGAPISNLMPCASGSLLE